MSEADVTYSCGSCGYPLNLTSSDRITSGIDSKYRKSMKRGYVSFASVDVSRFTQLDQVNYCFPISWRCHHPKTKLLCRKCGTHIGYAYGYADSALYDSNSPRSSSSENVKFAVKIHAVQPTGE